MALSAAERRNVIDAPATPSLSVRLQVAEQAVNPLLESARILLQALADMPAALDAEAVVHRRRWLEHEIRVFAWICGELRLRPEHVRSASYCLCSALDEAAMQTSWGSDDATGAEWQANGLAVAFGYDRQGGDRVFRLIDEAMRSPRGHLDLIEVFQNILDLGFRGRFRFEHDGRKRLLAIRERVHNVVVTGRLCVDRATEPVRLARPLIDPWVRPAAARRPRLWIVGGLVVALLLGAAGYAAVDQWVRAKDAQRMSLALDPLTQALEEHLRDQIAAGNVELIRNAGQNTLTVRFGGMFMPGDAAVAPWGASVVASAGHEIAALSAEANVLVVGYADSVPAGAGHQGANQALSEARARQVAKILVSAGLSGQRISAIGKSDADPLADNDTKQGRARNRRVEVTVLESTPESGLPASPDTTRR
ncbi:type IVB secretion system protein IcmH/DotU [Burkholderia ubonensis]|uniref:type IVB secretion system protein IcmH/DotU n=1 Tax=Burkholderia ubonensis TaxID=101571 RepID=UPI002AAFB68A|nr:type IVB secretion system protein IcmH/DotU [Burkholderia ubonensis]